MSGFATLYEAANRTNVMLETSIIRETKGITVLAPNDAAVSAVSALAGTLNSTELQAVLMNHVGSQSIRRVSATC